MIEAAPAYEARAAQERGPWGGRRHEAPTTGRTRALLTRPGARQQGCGPGSAQESPPDSRARRADAEPATGLDGYGATSVWVGKTGNDPSAGSPTETLLRLLLPLNDKVRTASRGVAAGEPAAAPQSGGLTGSFNR